MFTGKRKSLGQGMTEYIIIVALIAIAAITIYTLFGNTIRSQMASMTQELAGQQAATGAAAGLAGEASAEGQKKKDLNTYVE